MYSLVFYSLSGYRYLGDGGTDRREILHDGTYQCQTDLLPWGGTPGSPKSEILGINFGHLTATISKMVSRSVTCQLAPHQLDEGFLKMCKSQGGSPPGECTPPVWRACVLLTHLFVSLHFCYAILCISAAYAVMRCLCVCHVCGLCQQNE